MAWIKAQSGKLVDAGEFILTSAGGGAGNDKRVICSGGIMCGVYGCQDIAGRVMDAIEGWLIAGAPRVFVMPDKDYARWAPKTVQDVKIFPAHDASKPIYGAFTTEPGDIIEVLVGGETLTCKVTKTVRKTSHGTFTARLGE